MKKTLAIIAGSGQFPLYVARSAHKQGRRVVAVGIQGWVDSALSQEVDAYQQLSVGQLGEMLRWFKSEQAQEAIMAGKVTKAALFESSGSLDDSMKALLAGVEGREVTDLLGAIGQQLSQIGIQLLDSSTFLQSDLCREGVLTKRSPSAQEHRDIAIGLKVARQLAALDVGQTVVVKREVIVAAEAIEGTDAAIRRAHSLVGEDLVVVKVASPTQDRRFDLPIVGIETLRTLQDAGVRCLAAQAGDTLLLDHEAVIASANEKGICLVGVAVE